jgi:hypothetical protein
MPIPEMAKIWMDGELVDWDDARVNVLTPTLHYGWGSSKGSGPTRPTAGRPSSSTGYTWSACTARHGSCRWTSPTRSTS